MSVVVDVVLLCLLVVRQFVALLVVLHQVVVNVLILPSLRLHGVLVVAGLWVVSHIGPYMSGLLRKTMLRPKATASSGSSLTRVFPQGLPVTRSLNLFIKSAGK